MAADAVTVWIQIGLGVAILVGGTGRAARSVLVASAAWGAFVWVVGEALGGAADPTWSLLNGAPGAALLYVAASVVLLLPVRWWTAGAAQRSLRVVVGLGLLLGAVLQVLPRGGWWTHTGLSRALSMARGRWDPWGAGRSRALVGVLGPRPRGGGEHRADARLADTGVGLLLDRWRRPTTIAAAVVCLLAWWLGQG